MTSGKVLLNLPAIEGRTFVCGDIHGSFSCVERFLKEIGFNKEKDRFICAGDMVDRGPENEKVLTFLFEPWFYACLGNHEDMMIHYFHTGLNGMGGVWARNGGAWGTKYGQWAQYFESGIPDESLKKFVNERALPKLMELPLVITVQKTDGTKYHVLHAELPHWGTYSDEDLSTEDKVKDIAGEMRDDGVPTIIWGRNLFYPMYRSHIDDRMIRKWLKQAEMQKTEKFFKNLSPIYSGHTIVKRPIQFYGQTNLDTMAYGSYGSPGGYGYAAEPPPDWAGLTVTEPETGKFWLVNDRVFKEVQPIRIPGDENLSLSETQFEET